MQRDEDLLLDIVQAAEDVMNEMAGLSLGDFKLARGVQLAAQAGLTIIGEAARRVSPEFKATHPEIEWRAIIALRNLLVHEYQRISLDRIHEIATVDLPQLVAQISPHVPRPPDEDSA